MDRLRFLVLFSLLLLILQPHGASGQVCGTLQTPDSILAKNPWRGNNKYLLNILKESGYELPVDYFDRIDARGMYNGKILQLSDYKMDEDDSKRGESGGRSNLLIGNQTVRYIRVRAFIHQDASGNGFTEAEVRTHFNNVNVLFRNNNVPIIFYVHCNDITIIPNSSFYNIANTASIYAMFAAYGYGSIAISAHFSNSINSGGDLVSGFAWGVPGSALVVAKSGGSATLAHELGHCLGLLHTHNGTPPCAEEGNEDCADCWQEPVSRTMTQPVWCLVNVGAKKCEVYGDQLADTPGEPRLNPAITSSCTINWSLTDPTDNWNAHWTPMQYNIMSYARYSPSIDCRSLFTAGQIAVMLYNIPSFATTSDSYTIQGSTSACTNVSTIYSVPVLSGVSTYTWEVIGGTILSGQGTNQISVSFTSGGVKSVIMTPDCGYPWSTRKVNVLDKLQVWGPSLVNTNEVVSYSTNFAFGSSYDWLQPPGWGIISGQSSNSVTMRASSYASTGDIRAVVHIGSCLRKAYFTVQTYSGPPLLVAPNDDDWISTEIFNLLTGRKIVTIFHDDDNVEINMLENGFYVARKMYIDRVETIKFVKNETN
ncbi:MAG: hypothetical protein K8H85_12050 [Cyclobacteriaceae bacterium]|nr:hypothetical protein [Cyclobacteriaceae bacterium]